MFIKAVIFAGGVGTRLWPLSRKKSPKQFEQIVGEKSTVQLAVERLLPDFSIDDIYISTGDQYKKLVQKQLPGIPVDNVIGEPAMRDVGPAVGLVSSILARKFPKEPFAILWSDHLVTKKNLFKQILKTSGSLIKNGKCSIVFIGQKPKFANQNLGWIELGEKRGQKNEINFYKFRSWKYRPEQQLANKFYKSANYYWNTGYFVSTPEFLLKQYQAFVPEMYKALENITKNWGEEAFNNVLEDEYPKLDKISFDDAVVDKIDNNNALVIAEDLGWDDIGAWEALKEALQKGARHNVTKGKVLITDCNDNLIYNYTSQTVAAIDLKEMLVVNTDDVLLVCKKDSVPKIKGLVRSLAGTEDEHLT